MTSILKSKLATKFAPKLAKTLGLAAFATFALTQTALASTGKLTALDCVASNGVKLKSTNKAPQDGQDGLVVSTTWGLFQKDFEAKLGVAGFDTDSYIVLNDKYSKPAYLISLAIDPSLADVQTATGTLLRPSIFPGGVPTLVASVHCSVQLSQQQ